MANIRGSAVAGRLRYVRRYFGADALERVLSAVDDPAALATLRGTIDDRAWYPLDQWIAFTEATDRECGEGDGGLFRTMAAQVAEDDLSTILKMFMRVATPAMLLSRAHQLWGEYYDSGALVVKPLDPREFQVDIEAFDTPHIAHCEAVAGWIERSVQLTGIPAVVVDIQDCRARGDTRCRMAVHWGRD